MTSISISLEEEPARQLKILAERFGFSEEMIASRAVELYLESQAWVIADIETANETKSKTVGTKLRLVAST